MCSLLIGLYSGGDSVVVVVVVECMAWCVGYIENGLCLYSKTSLNRPLMGLILSGPFKEVVGLGS